ncbi:MAG: hypothetical protein UZ17_ACD001001782 [Acidobacteria bacterium OLB17]|nr:MAG: hypothetical protein UZ17_ACD001001782 [Acidobacteria bacterium OLB17]
MHVNEALAQVAVLCCEIEAANNAGLAVVLNACFSSVPVALVRIDRDRATCTLKELRGRRNFLRYKGGSLTTLL